MEIKKIKYHNENICSSYILQVQKFFKYTLNTPVIKESWIYIDIYAKQNSSIQKDGSRKFSQ
jgi:hypothetical protein